jgi:hypothetical protein
VPLDRGAELELGVPSLRVVEAKVPGQGAGAVHRAAVGLRVRPLVEPRANEAFGLAVGLGTVKPNTVVADLQPAAAARERLASVVAAVIRQQPADGDARRGVPSLHAFEEADGGRALFVGEHLGVAHAPDLPQLLHVEMDRVPGRRRLWRWKGRTGSRRAGRLSPRRRRSDTTVLTARAWCWAMRSDPRASSGGRRLAPRRAASFSAGAGATYQPRRRRAACILVDAH